MTWAPLAFCKNLQTPHVFQVPQLMQVDPGINIKGLTLDINMPNLTCPYCGQRAAVMKGTFDLIDGAITSLRTTDAATIDALSRILGEVQRGSISGVEASTEVARVAPFLRPLMDYLKANHLAWIGILISLLAAFLAHRDAQSSDELMQRWIGELSRTQTSKPQAIPSSDPARPLSKDETHPPSPLKPEGQPESLTALDIPTTPHEPKTKRGRRRARGRAKEAQKSAK